MNFVDSSSASVIKRLEVIDDKYALIHIMCANDSLDYTWKPDCDIQFLSSACLLNLGVEKYAVKRLIIGSGIGVYEIADSNTTAFPRYSCYNQNFNSLYIYRETPIRFYCINNSADACWISYWIRYYNDERIFEKERCGIIDWLKGECVHGIN